MQKIMTLENGKKIIDYVVNFPPTKEKISKWEFYSIQNIDYWFLHRGYEQQGFASWELLKILGRNLLGRSDPERLKSRGKELIAKLGVLLSAEEKRIRKYDRAVFGGLDARFYSDLKAGKKGEIGTHFYAAVCEFSGARDVSKSGMMWRLIWLMLKGCSQLVENYEGSFLRFLEVEFSKTLNREVTADTFGELTFEDWEKIAKAKPWGPISGLGPQTFPYIIRDVKEISFGDRLSKLDSTNVKFMKRTGIYGLADPTLTNEDEKYKSVMDTVRNGHDIRLVNRAIYLYCSKTENPKPFCYSEKACVNCGIKNLCSQEF